MRKDTIRIGTRSSQLALWQANWVKKELEKKHSHIECVLKKIKTKGDKITDVPLANVGGKGLFVKEIEEALIRKEIDIAVHSMKDVPTILPKELEIRVVTEREDFRDALISNGNVKLRDLPSNSRIGTSSLRRQAQLLHIHPEFQILPLRGNLDTRLKKLTTSPLDAIILAAAGLKRLGWEDRITEYISPEIMLPAIAQGALGIESRIDDHQTNGLIDFLNSRDSKIIITAERHFLRRLEGGCQVPIAALGKINSGILTLKGIVGSTDGKVLLSECVEGTPDEPVILGDKLAEKLLAAGALDILREVYPATH